MSHEFDKNRVAIRERNLIELFDLALPVIRTNAFPLAMALLAGIVPFALANGLILYSLTSPDSFDPGSDRMAYLWIMLVMIAVETPLATAPATLYLGQAMFHEKASIRRLASDYRRSLPQMFFYQFVCRGLLWPICFVPGILPYIFWPYLSEVILLERNPMFSGRRSRQTTFRRARMFHGGEAGDFLGGALLSVGIGFLMTISFCGSLYLLLGWLTGQAATLQMVLLYHLPVSLWLSIGYFTVVRFLRYLDLRIRREGWEVELALRAEAAQLAERLT